MNYVVDFVIFFGNGWSSFYFRPSEFIRLLLISCLGFRHIYSMWLCWLPFVLNSGFRWLLMDRFRTFAHCCHVWSHNRCRHHNLRGCKWWHNRWREKWLLNHRIRCMHPLLLKINFPSYRAPPHQFVLQEDCMSRFYKLCVSVGTVETIAFGLIWIANKMARYCFGV